MINKRQLEQIWLACQAIFLVHFTPAVVRTVVRIPRVEIPLLNALSLIGVYASSLYGTPLSEIHTRLEFFCIAFFLSQPPKIFFFPFYLNSLVNLAIFVASRPRRNRQGVLFKLAQAIIARQEAIIDMKILVEIVNLPLCVVLIILGYANMITLLIYAYLIRTQFYTDKTMRKMFLRVRLVLDKYSLWAPPGVRNVYVKARDYLIMTTLDRKNK